MLDSCDQSDRVEARYPAQRRVAPFLALARSKPASNYMCPPAPAVPPTGPCEARDGFFDCFEAFWLGSVLSITCHRGKIKRAPSDAHLRAARRSTTPKQPVDALQRPQTARSPAARLLDRRARLKRGACTRANYPGSARRRAGPRDFAPGGHIAPATQLQAAAAPPPAQPWRERPPASRAARSARPSTEGRCRATCPRSRAPPVEYYSRRRSRPTASRATLLWLRPTRPSRNLVFVGSRRCQCPSMRWASIRDGGGRACGGGTPMLC